jgi:hypothetical protein
MGFDSIFNITYSPELSMTVPIKDNLEFLLSASKDIQENKVKTQSKTSNKDSNAFDAVLEDAVSSTQTLDKAQIQILLLSMRMQMNNRLFSIATYDKKDSNPVTPFSGLMNINITGSLPEPSASKIEHQPQKNDKILPSDDIDTIINHAADRFSVDPDLIRGVIKAESNFNIHSTSPKGAMGLMQLMPATAKDLGVGNPYDPYENVMGGTRYLKGLLDRYDGDVDRALAAYNWGMGNVEKHPYRLPRETRTYIARIKQYFFEAKA